MLADVAEVQDMGKRFYYWLLRDICLKEEQRLKRSNFGPLLKDEKMHRALLAFCFEVLLMQHPHALARFSGVERALACRRCRPARPLVCVGRRFAERIAKV